MNKLSVGIVNGDCVDAAVALDANLVRGRIRVHSHSGDEFGADTSAVGTENGVIAPSEASRIIGFLHHHRIGADRQVGNGGGLSAGVPCVEVGRIAGGDGGRGASRARIDGVGVGVRAGNGDGDVAAGRINGEVADLLAGIASVTVT